MGRATTPDDFVSDARTRFALAEAALGNSQRGQADLFQRLPARVGPRPAVT
jgi:hypothetical protein